MFSLLNCKSEFNIFLNLKVVIAIIVFAITISFSVSIWSPDLNSLNLPTYRTIGKSGIIDYAFWVGLKLGLIARDKNIEVIKLPLINLTKSAFSNQVFLQLNYCNSFIKGLHSTGITVIASVVTYNSYLIKNMDYDFLCGKFTMDELNSQMAVYRKIIVSPSKDLQSEIDSYLKTIYIRSITKLKLTNLPYKSVKVVGKDVPSWSDSKALKTLSISATPVKCNTLFIIGDKKVDLGNYENVFKIFQYNSVMEEIIKDIVIGNLLEKHHF